MTMARISLMLGKNRDMPFTISALLPMVAPGTVAGPDYEAALAVVPDLTKIGVIPTGSMGDLPVNAVTLRAIYFTTALALTGVVANNETFTFNRRSNLGVNIAYGSTIASGSSVVTPITGTGMSNIQVGTRLDIGAVGTPETVQVTAVSATTFTATFANTHTFVATPITIVNSAVTPYAALPVNTTSTATTTSVSTMACTPVSMANIFPGTSLNIAAGGGTAETVVVQSVTATTFTATFTSIHTPTYAITSTPLATLALNVTTTTVPAMTPYLLNPLAGNILVGGDVITVQRTSNNATGLAADLASNPKYVIFEFVPARIGR